MDYLELDDSAIQAFEELGDDFGTIASRPPASTSVTLSKRSRRRVEAMYLFMLEDPFHTPRDLANALGLPRVPQLQKATTEHGDADFCQLSRSCIATLDLWVTKHLPSRKFTKIQIGLAHRDVRSLPFLGRDITLPHHRPQQRENFPNPGLERPIHYFFYGTLADPARLERLLDIPAQNLPPLEPAILLDGSVRTWAGKYKALVDKPGARVNGFAFLINSLEQEDALRIYEGNSYEVVEARFTVNGRELIGRTFRFAGFDDELMD